MSTMEAQTRSSDGQSSDSTQQEIQNLRREFEVQAATQAGANSTQAATHAGTWSAMIAGAAGLVVGMFLALTITAVARSS